MDIVIMVLQFIAALTLLVFIHEMGHFLAAKAFKIRVEKFYVFFDVGGKKLFSFTRGETEYGMGLIPLGGYVKIAGMIDESMDKEQMKNEPEDWEFRSKPAWQRFIVMIGGIVMNIILGVIIYSMSLLNIHESYLPASELVDGIYAYELAEEVGLKTGDKIIAIDGDEVERFKDLMSAKMLLGDVLTVERDGQQMEIELPKNFFKKFAAKGKSSFIALNVEGYPFTVDQIGKGTAAEKAGLQSGDSITAINGNDIKTFGNFRSILKDNKGETITISIDRDGESIDIRPTVTDQGTIGFSAINHHNYTTQDYTFASAFSFGASDAFKDLFYQSIIPFGRIFTGDLDPSESLQGPVGIATMFGTEYNALRFWYLTGLISMVLAFMNFLPIPALDGGHILFILVEMVTRRKLSEKFLERAQVVGMILLLSLMVLIIGNDILRLFQ